MARLVNPEELTARVAGIFSRIDVPTDEARIVAEHLVEADLRGVHSHGVIRVPTYVAGIKKGSINPRPKIEVVEDNGGQVVMDGDFGLGQLTAFRANELAIERGKEHGMAAVALRRSTHCGAMAYYALRARAADLIGIAITNAGMNMTPTGGTQKIIGNNPFAMAVPTTRDWPMVLDMATSVVAGGKLDVARSKGQSIPLGWARDKDGNPTTDPVAARAGSLEAVGDYKGYGMAVMLDVLAGVLSGGRFGGMLGIEAGRGVEAGAPPARGEMGQFFMTFNVERFMPLEMFKARMDELIDQIHASPKAPGVDRIYVAGEIEHGLQSERLAQGLPIEESVLAALDTAASEVGA
jgi:LDH2 family malate/lactate/ureidoglycolate dehydrogenase